MSGSQTVMAGLDPAIHAITRKSRRLGLYHDQPPEREGPAQ
jgi:hypothetical protein